jgi:hypothetical protein
MYSIKNLILNAFISIFVEQSKSEVSYYPMVFIFSCGATQYSPRMLYVCMYGVPRFGNEVPVAC